MATNIPVAPIAAAETIMLGARQQLEIRLSLGRRVGHQLDHELPVEAQIHDAREIRQPFDQLQAELGIDLGARQLLG